MNMMLSWPPNPLAPIEEAAGLAMPAMICRLSPLLVRGRNRLVLHGLALDWPARGRLDLARRRFFGGCGNRPGREGRLVPRRNRHRREEGVHLLWTGKGGFAGSRGGFADGSSAFSRRRGGQQGLCDPRCGRRSHHGRDGFASRRADSTGGGGDVGRRHGLPATPAQEQRERDGQGNEISAPTPMNATTAPHL